MRDYDFFGFLILLLNYIKTKLFFPGARIVRGGFRIRGRKGIDLGVGLTTGVGCRVECFSKTQGIAIRFGGNLQINDYVHIAAIEKVSIGNDVLIASRVFISDHNHGDYFAELGSDPVEPPVKRPLSSAPVIIGDNVWLGEGVCVLPGVEIGSGSIIGANAVVTKNIPANVIAVGIPAKPIKKFNSLTKTWQKL